jgi:hypothetical protein
MATVTPNFNFPVPQSTDLVKDGATAIAALGTSVDTQFVDLKGGTTGQVLAKASNTDLDYSWTTPQVGDITAVTAGTGITGGGTSGAVTVSFDQANFGGGQFAAGKNKILNGDFGIWQRGTSFSSPATNTYLADRWCLEYNGTGATRTISQQTFTPGSAPVAGYEGTYFLRYNQSVAGTGGSFNLLEQRIEDVRTFAGQTVTLSFWAKASATTVLPRINLVQIAAGGAEFDFATSVSIGTTWTRYSYSVAVGSLAGLSISANSSLRLDFRLPLNSTFTVDFWGVQLEAGSTATPFQTATGTIQGELAACQRYYQNRWTGTGKFYTSTTAQCYEVLPVQMRVAPTLGTTVSGNVGEIGVSDRAISAIFSQDISAVGGWIAFTTASATSGAVAGCFNVNIQLSAEL